MKYKGIRFQLALVALLLLATFAMILSIVSKNNKRWDATTEKIYSISPETVKLLQTLKGGEVEVLAFYPHDDPARAHFEVFMRQCQLNHSRFRYHFYDPDRVPSLAKQYGVKTYYTVVIRYGGGTENIVSPSEESFSNALLRLANPKKIGLCFVTGHGEIPAHDESRAGLSVFSSTLESMNYDIHDIILMRDKIPAACQLVIVPGPHQDFDPLEFKMLKDAFYKGKGILFLLDPMDPGEGKGFRDFFETFGVLTRGDVIVDKMSRVVGGDFMVPLVNHYVLAHPITAHFDKPTFYPVARSLQPSDKVEKGFDVVPLALTGNESWSETNLLALEQGDAAFEPASGDLQGPLPVVMAVEYQAPTDETAAKSEKEKGGKPAAAPLQSRLVVVGDSDFLNNAYVGLSGNNEFALNVIQWLSHDDRFISIHPREPEFKPLFLTARQRTLLLFAAVFFLPAIPLAAGGFHLRRRKSS